MSFSDYTEQAIVNWLCRGTAMPTAPTNVYIAAFTASPTDVGTSGEVVGNGYARIAVAATTAQWSAHGTGGPSSNVNDILFAAAATANWGTVTHVARFDALTGGNMLDWGALSVSKAVNVGDQLKIAAGSYPLTVD